MDPTKPSLVLLQKLGGIVVGARLMAADDGSAATELGRLLADEEVSEWINAMGPLLPA